MRTSVLAILLTACTGPSPSLDGPALQTYAHDVEHGLTKERTVGDIRTRVTLLPAALTAWRALQAADDSCADPNSVLDAHKRMLTFELAIGPSADARGDVLLAGARNAQEVQQRVYALHFDWASMVELTCGSHRSAPVLSAFENTYGITEHRTVTLAFAPRDSADMDFHTAKEIRLTWDDQVFGTGRQHFLFDRADLEALPPTAL
ncbi:MAG: hypothetical protein IPM49_06410 [Flavobacteriales bacterium]|nr:hypothetical protein [Flavobacteriales bacterium]